MLRDRAAARNLARHRIERAQQEAKLVVTRQGQLPFIVSRGHRLGALDQVVDRRHQLARGDKRQPDRRQHAQQPDDRQRHGKTGFQRIAQHRQFLVAVVGFLHADGQLVDPVGERELGLQRSCRLGRVLALYQHYDFYRQAVDRIFDQSQVRAVDLELADIGQRQRLG